MLPLVAAADDTRARRTRRDVRRVAAALGAVRELDVTIGLLGEGATRHAWHPGVVTQVREHLERARQDRQKDVVEALRRVGTAGLLRDLRRWAAGAARGGVAACHRALAEQRRARAGAMEVALRALGTLYVPDRLHEVRLCAKKLRYSLETERAVRLATVTRDIQALTGMQEGLGALHDVQVLQDWLRRLGRDIGSDRATQAQLRRMAVELEGECRAMHAQAVALAPAWLKLARRLEQR